MGETGRGQRNKRIVSQEAAVLGSSAVLMVRSRVGDVERHTVCRERMVGLSILAGIGDVSVEGQRRWDMLQTPCSGLCECM